METVATTPTRIAMVEDDLDFQSSVAALLHCEPDVHLSKHYDHASFLLAQAQKALDEGQDCPWDLVLMDIGLPDIDGCEATRKLKTLYPQCPVLVLTVFEEPGNVLAAICAGANGYLLKDLVAHELINAITSLKKGDAPLSARIASTVLSLVQKSHSHHRGPALVKDLGLSRRELDVLHGLVDGLSYREIGERLHISQDTVRSHIRKIYSTLQVHRVSEAVTYALRHGLF
ncbi:MAG: response regulator transcription factor [Sinobacteraceae bacterium]|nr:response regulator transcription factor [Nevskiaceae bacterium]